MNQGLRIKLISIGSIFCFLLSLYIFGYASDKYAVDPDDFTISRAVAYGNSITWAAILFACLGALLLIILQHLRNDIRYGIIVRDIIILIILGLFIAIMFVTPYQPDGTTTDNQQIGEAHAGLAVAAFTLVLIYNMFIYILLYKKYKTKLPLIFLGINVLVFIALFVPVIIEVESFNHFMTQSESDDLNIAFATFENINYLTLLVVVGMLGFYMTKLSHV